MTRRFGLALVGALVLFGTGTALGAASQDDPGPRLQYGGTPIELHYDAPGANVTKVYVEGTPCIIVSDGDGTPVGTKTGPVLALSCDWAPR